MCAEHRALLDTYHKAVALYSTAVEALKASRGTTSKDDYARHYGYVEQTRLKAEQARLDLENHVVTHRCVSVR